MASLSLVTECAGIWELEKVTQILSSATDMIQVTSAIQDDTDKDASEELKPLQASIYKDLLCLFSTYYRAALQGSFLEAENKSVVLDLDTEHCYSFIGWLYSGRLPDALKLSHLFEIYVFADKTDILALRRAIMTRIVESEPKRIPHFYEAAVALDSLPSTSPLYRYLLDTYVHHWLSRYPTAEDTLPNAFHVDWVKRAADRTCIPSKESCSKCPCCEENSCNYHEHESVEEWTSTCGASKEFTAQRPDRSCLVKKIVSKTN